MNNSAEIILTANGKLLITGEYLVLDGATALAFPTRVGQTLNARPSAGDCISWIASDINGVWFKADYIPDNFEILQTSDYNIALSLKKILEEAAVLNPLHNIRSAMEINTELSYNRFMGLGSSSTLIALVAGLFSIDKFMLHRRISSGSGYDVACSEINYPILYKRTSIDQAVMSPVSFNPDFINNLWLLWLGNKQNTDDEIKLYNKNHKTDKERYIKKITDITLELAEVKELTTFTSLLEVHEEIISAILNRDTIKHRMFNDFKGCIKSLGAWGGDFVLACTEMNDQYVFNYFAKKDIKTVYHFKDLVLNEKVSNNNDTIIRF